MPGKTRGGPSLSDDDHQRLIVHVMNPLARSRSEVRRLVDARPARGREGEERSTFDNARRGLRPRSCGLRQFFRKTFSADGRVDGPSRRRRRDAVPDAAKDGPDGRRPKPRETKRSTQPET